MKRKTRKLEWIDGRWHCDGLGIHAGEGLELLGNDGEWFRVRIESSDQGRILIAYINHHGHLFTHRIDTDCDQLRWPQ